jgi:hypothetical protein
MNNHQSSHGARPTALRILRPEARHLSWQQFDRSQRGAFCFVIKALAESVCHLDDYCRVSAAKRNRQHAFFEEGDYAHNQTLLIDGERGTGKTSLLMSVQKALIRYKDWAADFARLKNENPDAKTIEEYQEVEPLITGSGTSDGPQVRERVVWLDPLEMDVLPGPVNLLAAILARVEEAVRRIGPTSGSASSAYGDRVGMLDQRPGYEDAMLQLRRLMADVSIAWDGNLKERAQHLDPEVFAAETMHAETARIQIQYRFREVLDAVAVQVLSGHRVINPLFVLPVDDLDLNPARTVELLRLLRMIQTPRLMTVVLADVRSLERVLHLKITNDFAQVAGAALDALGLQDNSFHTQHRDVSAGLLRKMIPTGQRIYLRHMSSDEILNFQPPVIPLPDLTLEQLLAGISIDLRLPMLHIPNNKRADAKVTMTSSGYANTACTLLDFLTGTLLWNDQKDVRKSAFPVDFQPVPRTVNDVWFSLQPGRHQNCQHQLLDVYRNAVSAEQNVDASSLQDFLDVFRESSHEGTIYEIKQDAVSVTAESADETRIYRTPDSECRVVATLFSQWAIESSKAGRNKSSDYQLSGTPAYLFRVMHDLAVLDTRNERVSLIKNTEISSQIKTVWSPTDSKEVVVPWRPPSFTSFLEWNQFIAHMHEASTLLVRPYSAFTNERLIDLLAFSWINAGNSVLTGTRPIPVTMWSWAEECGENSTTPSEAGTRQMIDDLAKSLNKIAELANQEHSERHQTARHWLCSVARVLAPESGTSGAMAEVLLKTSHAKSFQEFLKEPENATTIRQERAERAVEFFTHNESQLAGRLICPKMPGRDLPACFHRARHTAEATYRMLATLELDSQVKTENGRGASYKRIVRKFAAKGPDWTPEKVSNDLIGTLEVLADQFRVNETLEQQTGIRARDLRRRQIELHDAWAAHREQTGRPFFFNEFRDDNGNACLTPSANEIQAAAYRADVDLDVL